VTAPVAWCAQITDAAPVPETSHQTIEPRTRPAASAYPDGEKAILYIMSSDPGDITGRSQDRGRRPPGGSQGASRGGFQPDDDANSDDRAPTSDDGAYERGAYGQPGTGGNGGFSGGSGQSRGQSSGGAPSSSGRGSGRSTPTFLGLPVTLIYALGAAIIGIVIIGAVCGKPTATGSVAGQIKSLSADHSVNTLAGAQIVLRGANQTYTATSTDVPANADGEAAYNYHIENVPPGNYTMAVTPPDGSNLQPEQDISLKVESGQLFPQSALLLAQGIQKPRPLAQNELQPGEAGGYINDQGQRITYQQGSGFDPTDALLLYLLWRNPPGYGYGYPPVIVSSPGSGTFGSSGYSSNYRVSDPPTQSRSGQTVTQRKPETPGQGSTRPSSSTGATGSGPSYSSGPSTSGSSSGSGSGSSSGSSSTGSGSGPTTTRPSTSSGSGSSVSAPSVPSQGASRPSSSSSSPSRSSAPSRSSGSSSGGRR